MEIRFHITKNKLEWFLYWREFQNLRIKIMRSKT